MYSKDIESRAKYILGSSSNRKIADLSKALNQNIDGYGVATFEDINQFEEPKVKASQMRFNYSLPELQSLANRSENSDDFYIFASSICGVEIDDDFALQYVGVPEEKTNRFLRAIITINDRPFTMRVVPNCWQKKNSIFATNFHIRGNVLFLESQELGRITSYCKLCSINNSAYIAKNLNKENVLCINPLQYCGQACKFCLRTQDIYSRKKKNTLINLDPAQMCRFLISELPDIEFGSLNEIYISTGRFTTKKDLLRFLKTFKNEVSNIWGDKFDPARNQNQWFKVSSHLLDTYEAMAEAKQYGVKKYLYPIEIISNSKRKAYMTHPSMRDNKGDVSFEGILGILSQASNVFGIDKIEPVLIIGLDTYQDTMRGLRALKNGGYEILTHTVFRAYTEDQLQYYSMDLGEIVDVLAYIKNNFGFGYSQVVDLQNKSVKKSYIEV